MKLWNPLESVETSSQTAGGQGARSTKEHQDATAMSDTSSTDQMLSRLDKSKPVQKDFVKLTNDADEKDVWSSLRQNFDGRNVSAYQKNFAASLEARSPPLLPPVQQRLETAVERVETSEKQFEARQRALSDSFNCDECGMIMKRKSDLERHEIEKHGEPDTYFRCDGCGWDDVRLDKVKDHCRMKHGQQSGFERYSEEFGRRSRVKRPHGPTKSPPVLDPHRAPPRPIDVAGTTPQQVPDDEGPFGNRRASSLADERIKRDLLALIRSGCKPGSHSSADNLILDDDPANDRSQSKTQVTEDASPKSVRFVKPSSARVSRPPTTLESWSA